MTPEQKKHNQKFLPGDLVRVQNAAAYEHGIEGIVRGSYADLYDGRDERVFHQYSIIPPTGGYRCAWYDEGELILVKTRAEMDADRSV